MKIHRFFISDNLEPGSDLILHDARMVRQIKTVLRVREGETIVLFNDRGQEAHARVAGVSSNQITCCVESVAQKAADVPGNVTVYCAILKRENFEWVAQKITEIGARALVPCLTARTIKQRIAPERIAAIMREAAEQSGRVTVPALGGIVPLSDALDAALAEHALCIFFDPRGMATEDFWNRDVLGGAINIFIGPEGGWSDEEYDYARARGARIVSLGDTVLRAETAAVVGAYAAVRGCKRGRDKAD